MTKNKRLYSHFERPKYINKPFSELPLKKRAVFILYLAGFTYEDIVKTKIVVSPDTLSRWLTTCKEKYER